MTEEKKGQEAPVETVNKADYEKALERAQRFEAQLTDREKVLERYKNIDPDKVYAMEQELKDLRKEAALGDSKRFDEEIQRRETEIRTTVEKELNEARELSNSLRAKNKELEVTDKFFGATSPQLIEHAYDDAREYIRKFCDRDEQGNLIIKDENGKPRYKKGSTTQLMGMSEFTEFLAEQKPHWFKAKGKPGVATNGQPVQTNSYGIMTTEKYLSMSENERKSLSTKDRMALSTKVLGLKI